MLGGGKRAVGVGGAVERGPLPPPGRALPPPVPAFTPLTEVPDNIHAFFEHPLVASSGGVGGGVGGAGGGGGGGGGAILHEFRSLAALPGLGGGGGVGVAGVTLSEEADGVENETHDGDGDGGGSVETLADLLR